jgi:hypothetical protein
MHGLVSLLLENQIPRSVVDRMSVRSMLVATLGQVARLDLEEPCATSP